MYLQLLILAEIQLSREYPCEAFTMVNFSHTLHVPSCITPYQTFSSCQGLWLWMWLQDRWLTFLLHKVGKVRQENRASEADYQLYTTARGRGPIRLPLSSGFSVIEKPRILLKHSPNWIVHFSSQKPEDAASDIHCHSLSPSSTTHTSYRACRPGYTRPAALHSGSKAKSDTQGSSDSYQN
mmetsp:Transcript_32394/g.52203  ORF Transcript_32394/g.52203 Transcript_32394/m.52203 type:complete len:181 (-) Transcript_32394:882-1424(-)